MKSLFNSVILVNTVFILIVVFGILLNTRIVINETFIGIILGFIFPLCVIYVCVKYQLKNNFGGYRKSSIIVLSYILIAFLASILLDKLNYLGKEGGAVVLLFLLPHRLYHYRQMDTGVDKHQEEEHFQE